jgi:hypothetical protein
VKPRKVFIFLDLLSTIYMCEPIHIKVQFERATSELKPQYMVVLFFPECRRMDRQVLQLSAYWFRYQFLQVKILRRFVVLCDTIRSHGQYHILQCSVLRALRHKIKVFAQGKFEKITIKFRPNWKILTYENLATQTIHFPPLEGWKLMTPSLYATTSDEGTLLRF